MNSAEKYYAVRDAIHEIEKQLDALRDVASWDGRRGEDIQIFTLEHVSEEIHGVNREYLSLAEWLGWLESDLEPETKNG